MDYAIVLQHTYQLCMTFFGYPAIAGHSVTSATAGVQQMNFLFLHGVKKID